MPAVNKLKRVESVERLSSGTGAGTGGWCERGSASPGAVEFDDTELGRRGCHENSILSLGINTYPLGNNIHSEQTSIAETVAPNACF